MAYCFGVSFLTASMQACGICVASSLRLSTICAVMAIFCWSAVCNVCGIGVSWGFFGFCCEFLSIVEWMSRWTMRELELGLIGFNP